MITKKQFNELKQYSDHASFAIWSSKGHSDTSIFEDESIIINQ